MVFIYKCILFCIDILLTIFLYLFSAAAGRDVDQLIAGLEGLTLKEYYALPATAAESTVMLPSTSGDKFLDPMPMTADRAVQTIAQLVADITPAAQQLLVSVEPDPLSLEHYKAVAAAIPTFIRLETQFCDAVLTQTNYFTNVVLGATVERWDCEVMSGIHNTLKMRLSGVISNVV